MTVEPSAVFGNATGGRQRAGLLLALLKDAVLQLIAVHGAPLSLGGGSREDYYLKCGLGKKFV
jgi:hypothetical protein